MDVKQSLLPEPDWRSLISSKQLDLQTGAILYMVYHNIRPTPKVCTSSRRATSEMKQGYRRSLMAISKVLDFACRQNKRYELKTLTVLYCRALGIKCTSSFTRQQIIAIGAAGPGDSKHRVKSPFALSKEQKLKAKWMVKLGWPGNHNAIHVKSPPQLCKKTRCFLYSPSGSEKPMQLATVQQAVSTIFQLNPEVNPTFGLAAHNQRRTMAIKDADGHRIRINRSRDNLLNEFHIAHIDTHPSLTDVERRRAFNNLYVAFLDLSHFLGSKQIGLGKLSIKVGYPPVTNDKRVESDIYVYGALGPGSIAHQYFEAVNGILGRAMYGEARQASDRLPADDLIDKRFTGVHAAWGKLLTTLHVECEVFRRNAQVLDAETRGLSQDYWSRDDELLARAFENHIHGRVKASGLEENWLVSGIAPEAGRPLEYPLASEQAILNCRLKNVFEELFKKRA